MQKEYFRSIADNFGSGIFSGKLIFGNTSCPNLWIHRSSNTDWTISEEKTEGSDEIALIRYSSQHAERISCWIKGESGADLAGCHVIITTNDNGTWSLRRATDEEVKANIRTQKTKKDHNLCKANYLNFGDDFSYLFETEKKNIQVNVIMINNDTEGSYLVVKKISSGDMAAPINKKKYSELAGERSSFTTTISRRTIYLPKYFVDKTGLGYDQQVRVWKREDGSVIIEGRPGICPKCGRYISRYKRPLTELCEKCDPDAQKKLYNAAFDHYISRINDL